ncbi:MAG: VCBS repeat-containing protein [Alphaproteobacteria bacterium]|nr:VCBS repeat-containing protein [Alphaproteobacteria bacterium]
MEAVRMGPGGSWTAMVTATGWLPDHLPLPDASEASPTTFFIGDSGGGTEVLGEHVHEGRQLTTSRQPYVARRSVHGHEPAVWLGGHSTVPLGGTLLSGELASRVEATDVTQSEATERCGDLTGDGIQESCDFSTIRDPASGDELQLEDDLHLLQSLPGPPTVFASPRSSTGQHLLCASQVFVPGTTVHTADLPCTETWFEQPFAPHRADDLDGDGTTDVAVGLEDHATVWSPTSGVLASVTHLGGELALRPALGDFDGDGSTDLAVPFRAIQDGQPGFAVHVFRSPSGNVTTADSDRQWVAPVMFDATAPYTNAVRGMVAVDLDGDGADELVLTGSLAEHHVWVIPDPLD